MYLLQISYSVVLEILLTRWNLQMKEFHRLLAAHYAPRYAAFDTLYWIVPAEFVYSDSACDLLLRCALAAGSWTGVRAAHREL